MEAREPTREDFRYGHCYWMAVALNRAFGHRIGALVVDLPKGGKHVVHAYCLDETGSPYDAVGEYPLDSMNEDYLENHRHRWTAFEHLTFETDGDFIAALVGFAASQGTAQLFEDMTRTETLVDRAGEAIPRFFPDRQQAPRP